MSATSHPFVQESKLNAILPEVGPEAIRKQAIDEDEQKLDRLNSTIGALGDKLSNLEIQQSTLRRQLNTYKSVISPIHKLFPEILQTIFIQCLPPMRNAVMSSREMPLLLGRICHQWREIAYATPHLWSSIHIVIHKVPTPPQSQRSPPIEEISAWLHRSGALPLSVSIHLPESILSSPTPVNINGDVQLYLGILAKFKSRWRSLYLSFPYCDWTAALSKLNAADLPLLEKFCIAGQTSYFLNDSGIYALEDLKGLAKDDGILRAPNLRILGIPFYGVEVPHLPIRWENLTSLTILGEQVFNTAAVRRMLLQCPNLTTCTLCVLKAIWPPDEDPSTSEINLPNLQYISFVEDILVGPTSHLLKHLHTPQLRHLSYEHRLNREGLFREDFPPLEFLSSLSAFLRRLVVPLEELNFVVENIADVDIIGILRLMPELKRLSLNHLVYPQDVVPSNVNYPSQCRFQDHHLLSLTSGKFRGGEDENVNDIHDGSQSVSEGGNDRPAMSLCPNLEVFHCIGASFSDPVLLNFLHSRCDTSGLEESGSPTRLKTASIVTILPKGQQVTEGTQGQIEQLQTENPSTSLDVAFIPWVDPPQPVHSRKLSSPYDGLWLFGKGW